MVPLALLQRMLTGQAPGASGGAAAFDHGLGGSVPGRTPDGRFARSQQQKRTRAAGQHGGGDTTAAEDMQEDDDSVSATDMAVDHQQAKKGAQRQPMRSYLNGPSPQIEPYLERLSGILGAAPPNPDGSPGGLTHQQTAELGTVLYGMVPELSKMPRFNIEQCEYWTAMAKDVLGLDHECFQLIDDDLANGDVVSAMKRLEILRGMIRQALTGRGGGGALSSRNGHSNATQAWMNKFQQQDPRRSGFAQQRQQDPYVPVNADGIAQASASSSRSSRGGGGAELTDAQRMQAYEDAVYSAQQLANWDDASRRDPNWTKDQPIIRYVRDGAVVQPGMLNGGGRGV